MHILKIKRNTFTYNNYQNVNNYYFRHPHISDTPKGI